MFLLQRIVHQGMYYSSNGDCGEEKPIFLRSFIFHVIKSKKKKGIDIIYIILYQIIG